MRKISSFIMACAMCLSMTVVGTVAPQVAVQAEETAGLLNRYLAELEPGTRRMFVRRYFAMDSVESLARDFGLSRNAVSARLSRARRGLRNYLEKEGIYV